MWNDTTGNAPPGAGSRIKLESPLVGASALLDAYRPRDATRNADGNAVQNAAAPGVFHARERAFCDLVNLRGDANDPAFAEAVARVTGCRPPQCPNTFARGSRFDVLWLGPDEWLVRSHAAPGAAQDAARLDAMLTTALTGQFASAVDVGSGYTTLELTGAKARDVLARGCPLDLHPRAFAAGQCAQSHFFKASIVLVATGNDIYEIIVRRSFADYFVRILLDAAAPIVA